MKIKLISTLSVLIISSSASSALLDKVAGVINDKVFTLSEINRVKSTIGVRREIAPFIFNKNQYSKTEVLKVLQNSYIIKDKLSELGFVVSDDSVEGRIKETEKGLRLNREELLVFLKSKGLTFNEYFELLRGAMEYNIFNRRIIAPLVTITDQELKNFYYKQNSKNKALSFKYKLLDFSLPKSKVLKADYKRIPSILNVYKTTGNIPEIYSDIDTNDLGELQGDDLPKELKELLKNTDAKNFTQIYVKDNKLHSFYLVEKDLTESEDFLRSKNAIYTKIFMNRADSLSQNWFSRESLNYYILSNL
jgi:peptidyl-prolyl cis-trans isomerase SurA